MATSNKRDPHERRFTEQDADSMTPTGTAHIEYLRGIEAAKKREAMPVNASELFALGYAAMAEAMNTPNE